MRTVWADLLNDALYNSLTQALFVDKNLDSAENTLALIIAEQNASLIPASLADCAKVASDYFKARKNAFLKELSPLKAESDLPAVYARLRKGLSSFMPPPASERKTQKGGVAALMKKFTDQFNNLERAKTSARYITWLKTAEQLEDMSKGTGNENIFSAVRAIAALVLELFRTGKGENLLRDPGYILESELFQAIPSGQTHPQVRSLWEFFCRLGERKYGAEWGEAARVAQLSFMAEVSQSALKKQYQILMKSNLDDLDVLILRIMRGASNWTDQELYILNAVFASNLENFDEIDSSYEMRFMSAFNMLTKIGRKWRPEAPWSEGIQICFDEILSDFPLGLITTVITDMPYDALSSYSLILLSLMDAEYPRAIVKAASNRLPLRLGEDGIMSLKKYAVNNSLPRWTVSILEMFIGKSESVSVLTYLSFEIIKESAMNALMGEPKSGQAWTEFSRNELPKELATALPQDNFIGCFCRLCSGMSNSHFSNDPLLFEEFLAALATEAGKSECADFFLIVLLTWQEVSPEFLVRLFEKTCFIRNRHDKKSLILYSVRIDLNDIANLVERMPNEANRRIVSVNMLALLMQNGKKKIDASLKEAITTLERITNVKKTKQATPVLGKTEKTAHKTNAQELLPFGD